jgi:Kef-type K+ transport system membrane component KefB
MSCAAIDDVMAWCVLAIASSFSKDSSAVDGGYTCMLAVLYVLAMFFLVRPLLGRVHSYFLQRADELNQFFLCGVFLVLLASSFAAEVIGIHAFFGAYVLFNNPAASFCAVFCCERMYALHFLGQS